MCEIIDNTVIESHFYGGTLDGSGYFSTCNFKVIGMHYGAPSIIVDPS